MDPFSCYERLGMADRTEPSMGLSCLVLSHRAPHILCSHTSPPCQVMRAANCFCCLFFNAVVGTVRVTENGADESKSSIGGAMSCWFLILTLVLCPNWRVFSSPFFSFLLPRTGPHSAPAPLTVLRKSKTVIIRHGWQMADRRTTGKEGGWASCTSWSKLPGLVDTRTLGTEYVQMSVAASTLEETCLNCRRDPVLAGPTAL